MMKAHPTPKDEATAPDFKKETFVSTEIFHQTNIICEIYQLIYTIELRIK
jgi:hypothetical protein